MSKKQILDFIFETMDEYVVERMVEITEDRDDDDERSESKAEFKRIQKDCVNKLKDNDTTLLKLLMKGIKSGKIMNMDEESCVAFDTAAFFFNKQKKLVIMNYR